MGFWVACYSIFLPLYIFFNIFLAWLQGRNEKAALGSTQVSRINVRGGSVDDPDAAALCSASAAPDARMAGPV